MGQASCPEGLIWIRKCGAKALAFTFSEQLNVPLLARAHGPVKAYPYGLEVLYVLPFFFTSGIPP